MRGLSTLFQTGLSRIFSNASCRTFATNNVTNNLTKNCSGQNNSKCSWSMLPSLQFAISKQCSNMFSTSACLNKQTLKKPEKNFSFKEMDRRMQKFNGHLFKKVKRRSKMWGKPQVKGVVLKLVIRKPKKPNSANRKCCVVRLSNGKIITAFIPGEGHNLMEHSVVLIEGGSRKDLVGSHHRVIRGARDCAHVIKSSPLSLT
uniref:Small ribosomal subunit protein uS12m n=1 Tax=Phallusia mammillata TaxID=59560 RepID=A0A6F9DLZ9_9ASCI|nr:40S ribosomal protein S12, mitochondrial-like [Phallusia mammillata]